MANMRTTDEGFLESVPPPRKGVSAGTEGTRLARTVDQQPHVERVGNGGGFVYWCCHSRRDATGPGGDKAEAQS